MFNKSITLITLTAFIIFILSCGGSTKYLYQNMASDYEGKIINIRRVEKTNGEIIQFTDASDRIIGNNIIGEAIVEKEIEQVSIPLSEVKVIEFVEKDKYQGGMVLSYVLIGCAVVLIPILAILGATIGEID